MVAKHLYRTFINKKENSIANLTRFKMFVIEWIEIFRKRSLYKDIRWTREQDKIFEETCLNNYGKKISKRWHKLYQSINGVFNPEYLPEIIYTTQIEHRLNPHFRTRIMEDKSMIELLISGKCNEKICVPKTLVVASNGILYNGDRNIISIDEAEKELKSYETMVIKPTIGSSSGEGVYIINNRSDMVDSISDLMSIYGGNFIIQEKIKPNVELEKIYNNSVNTMRVITYVLDGKVSHCPIALRIGVNKAKVDNIHAGGLVVHVKDNGHLDKEAYQLGWGDSAKKYEIHPDSDVRFSDYKLSFVPEIIESLYLLHGCFPGIGIVSWDVTVDDQDRIVIIEANLSGQSVWFPQVVSGRSLFGKDTKKILEKTYKTKKIINI